MDVWFIVAHAAFGLIVGSFLNVLILRSWTGRTMLGRSGCLACETTLTWRELIPVLSWIALRGRCATCGSRLSVQYPLVELTTALLFAGVVAASLPLTQHIFMLAVAALLVAIAAYDIRHTVIPQLWVYLFAALSFTATAVVLAQYADVATWFWFIAAGPLAALPLASLWLVSRGAWMGFGDVKLALGIGWLLGPVSGPIAVFGAFVLGAIVSVGILLPLPYMRHLFDRNSSTVRSAAFTMKSEVPFGPFLIGSTLIVWFIHAFDLWSVALLL